VRFLIPHALAQAHREAYHQFAKAHGQGKITAHDPHRDSWLDCPDNAINVWIAVGPVRKGNGLSIFPECYADEVKRTDSGSISPEDSPGVPINFDLAPGDAVIFHGDQLHASELNRLDKTRHVLSFRLTVGKPHFPNKHYHHYVSLSLIKGWGARFAEVPANLKWGYLATRLGWIWREVAVLFRKPSETDGKAPRQDAAPARASEEGQRADASDLKVGSLRPISAQVCVARIDDERVVAFARRCPHAGADLSLGTLREGRIICPWHNLPFDLRDGKSGCKGVGDLRLYPLAESEGRLKLSD
jgi:nitrite reductase/ring-hydroxylating ferredoxin subunit